MDNKTYVIGFWLVNGNKKHNFAHYKNVVPKTFRLLANKKIVFYYEDDLILQLVKPHLKTPHFKPIKLKLLDLPTYNLTRPYIQTWKKLANNTLKNNFNGQKEKHRCHLVRDVKLAGAENYHKIFTIWTSKVYLVNRVINTNPYKSNYFCWADLSIGRMNGRRKNYNFTLVKEVKSKLYHYGSPMIFKRKYMPFSAGAMIANKNIWQIIRDKVKQKLVELKNDPYVHDEETILTQILYKNPGLFQKIEHVKI